MDYSPFTPHHVPLFAPLCHRHYPQFTVTSTPARSSARFRRVSFEEGETRTLPLRPAIRSFSPSSPSAHSSGAEGHSVRFASQVEHTTTTTTAVAAAARDAVSASDTGECPVPLACGYRCLVPPAPVVLTLFSCDSHSQTKFCRCRREI